MLPVKTFLLLLVLLVGASTALPAQLDDAMWFAGRQGRKLTKVNACGEVLASVDLSGNGLDLDQVARAPDGRLWVINYITTRMTITDRNGGNPVNIDTSAIDPTGGATAIVFDRGGIGAVNIVEVQSGSSPYDSQSTPTNSLLTTGPTILGQTARVELRGAAGDAVLGFATGAPTSLTLPGIAGQLRLDPSRILGFTVLVTAPATLPVAMPSDPTFLGFVLRMQALKFGAPHGWSNDSCFWITN